MELVYHGQSCFEFNLSGQNILIDPFITPNPLVENHDLSRFNPDFILLTHGHGDHVADAEAIATKSSATIISNFEITTWYSNKGIEKTHGMNIGGKFEFPFGILKMVDATHSSTLPDGSSGGNPVGYVIQNEESTFYHAGDTGLFSDMKLISNEFDLNFAILPIGDNFTMGIDDALIAAEFLRVEKVIAMHFDTFPVIAINHEECRSKADEKGINLIIPKIEESINL